MGKNVGLLGDANKTIEGYIAERTWPYEVNPPGRNKLPSFLVGWELASLSWFTVVLARAFIQMNPDVQIKRPMRFDLIWIYLDLYELIYLLTSLHVGASKPSDDYFLDDTR
jgi:hypothetical protein